ncbi:MAG TPA: acyl-CoA dehydrogenase family protein, partial [Beijerinckiaceae bacterium]
MSLALSLAFADPVAAPVAARVRDAAQKQLPALVDAIDKGDLYPEDFLRELGARGAFAPHAGGDGAPDLMAAIDAMSEVAEVCGATAFMTWCQDTLAWYLANTDNEALKQRYLADVTAARRLGGTGLSNPMKSFFGIEKLKLRGRRVDGGYVVKGALPWVSNLGPDHLFGTIFECDDGGKVMFVADCADPRVELLPC